MDLSNELATVVGLVITSYSIHYTKLYDFLVNHFIAVCCDVDILRIVVD